MKHCSIIGISDSRNQWFPPEVMAVISGGRVFSGGKRHHDIVCHLLPADAQWIDIVVPLSDAFGQYRHHDDVVIFASGDPLFYGFANTVQRECPDVAITVYPAFNSLQMLAHRLCMPYHDMHVVSLTGRPWQKFDEALINGEPLIGCLTDRTHTPHAIMQRMHDYGYDNYMMYVGVNLGNEEKELVGQYDAAQEYPVPNCIILKQVSRRRWFLGIPDDEFLHLGARPEQGIVGRTKMITKMPIRLLTLSMLDLPRRRCLWDVGFCTGSISIEARLQFPHLHVEAFEIREEGELLIRENARRFGAPGISHHIGDFLQMPFGEQTPAMVGDMPRPDAVFIGGHGGRLLEIVQKVKDVLLPDGCIVFNSVSEESKQMFVDAVATVGMTITATTCIAIDDNNPITILQAQ